MTCVSDRSKYATSNNLLKGSKTDDINSYGASFASDGDTPTGFSNNFISGGPSKGLQKFQWVQVRRIEPWVMVAGNVNCFIYQVPLTEDIEIVGVQITAIAHRKQHSYHPGSL